jgi:hypothetical protein
MWARPAEPKVPIRSTRLAGHSVRSPPVTGYWTGARVPSIPTGLIVSAAACAIANASIQAAVSGGKS